VVQASKTARLNHGAHLVKTIPVDTSALTTLVGGAITEATSPDGTAKRDRQGRPLFSVPVVVVADGANADTMTVRVPGPVPQIAPLTPINLVGLIARYWSMEGRSGVSFSAEKVAPVARS
jgi:hypothetical protein